MTIINTAFTELGRIYMNDGSILSCPQLPIAGFELDCNGLDVGTIPGFYRPQHNASGNMNTYVLANGTTFVLIIGNLIAVDDFYTTLSNTPRLINLFGNDSI